MAVQLPDITARVRLDTSGLTEGVKEASKRGAAIGSAIGSAVGNLAGGGLQAGLAGLKEFAQGSVDAFAAVEDATGAAGVEFGKSVGLVTQFASKTAGQFNLSRRAALEAANTYGTFGKAAGLTGDNLAGFSTKLTGLAGDLASFKGTSAEQAIDAIGSALRGETEPLGAYGVVLNDTNLRQEALAQGLIKTTKQALTPQQKILAVNGLLWKRTSDAQGDAARTANSTANTQKRLANETENAQVALGQKLAPTLTFLRELLLKAIEGATGLFTVFNGIVSVAASVGAVLQSVAGFVRDNAVAFGILAAGLVILNAQFIALTIRTNASVAAFLIQSAVTKGVTAVTEGFAAAQAVLNGVLAANPIGVVVLAVAALVAGIILAYKHSETFRQIVQGAFNAIKAAASAVAGFFTGTLVPAIKGAFDKISGAVSAVVGFFRDHWQGLLAILTGPFGLAVKFIVDHFDTIKSVVKGVASAISSALGGAFDGLKNAFRGVVNFIIRGLNRLHFNVPSVDTHLPGVGKIGGFSVGVPHIPELAAGGTLMSAGRVLVGEKAPEILDLPRGARVTPLDKGIGRLHPDDIRALGRVVADGVVGGLNGVSSAASLRSRAAAGHGGGV